MNPDERIVSAQLGRRPRGPWRVAVRCPHDLPSVLAVAPLLEDGTPFPSTLWLTCPHLVEAVSRLESAGETAAWTDRAVADARLAARLADADVAYRAARAAEAGGVDPMPAVGVAGQSNPLVVKCLHARVAAFVAGIPDPIGEAVVQRLEESGVGIACADARCRDLG